MPKISVIIPVFNTDKYLGQCIESIINQTFKDIEIVCINDGSTDNSLKILEEYAQKDNRVRVISQENQGVSIARNRGIVEARGEYLIFVDSDDFLCNECLEEAIENICTYDADILCFGLNRVVNGNVIPREDCQYLSELPTLENIPHFLQNAAAKLFDSNFIKQNNILFPENIKTCEDGLFCLLCLYHNARFSYLDKCLYNYLIGREGSACTQQKTIVQTDIEAFKYILNTQDFKNTKDEFKIITIEKFFKHFEWNDTPEYRFFNYIRILQFICYLNSHIGLKILKECSINLKRFSLCKLILNTIFHVGNSSDKRHKIITILGINIKIKRKSHE